MADPPDLTSSSRLVIVAGSGRSGTSTVAGVLKYLGLQVPQPEVEANRTNPRGFFEPRWVVQFQQRLVNESGVPLSDARPEAFRITADIGDRPQVQAELYRWLAGQLVAAQEVVVKDPRNTWFLPMWRTSADKLGVVPGFVMMLRHPAEVVGSKENYYRAPSGDKVRFTGATRTANWINLTLATEEATRESRRALLRYTDLVQDWRTTMEFTAEALDLSMRHGFDPTGSKLVDDFVDPSLHRVKVTWDEIDVPQRLKDLAEEVWLEMVRLVDSGDRPESYAALDRLRADYRDLYDESEAIARSSTRAAVKEERQAGPRPRPRPRGQGKGKGKGKGNAAPDTPASLGNGAKRVARRLRPVAGRVRRRLQTAVAARGR